MVVRRVANAWRDDPKRIVKWAGFIVGGFLLGCSLMMLWSSGTELRAEVSGLKAPAAGAVVDLSGPIALFFDFLLWFASSVVISTFLLAVYAVNVMRTIWWVLSGLFGLRETPRAEHNETGDEAMTPEEKILFNKLSETVERLVKQCEAQAKTITKIDRKFDSFQGAIEDLDSRLETLEPEPEIPLTPEQILERQNAELQAKLEAMEARFQQMAAQAQPAAPKPALAPQTPAATPQV